MIRDLFPLLIFELFPHFLSQLFLFNSLNLFLLPHSSRYLEQHLRGSERPRRVVVFDTVRRQHAEPGHVRAGRRAGA